MTPTARALFAALILTAAPVSAQQGAPNGEWPTYGGDLGHTRYSALDQIDADTFDDLELAWRFSTENLGPGPEYIFQSTPLMVNGVLYTTAGTRRAAVAMDATTGEMLGHSKKSGYKSTLRYAAILNEDVVEALDLIDGPEETEEKVVKLTK